MNNKLLTETNCMPDICLHLNGVAPAPRRDFFDLKISLKKKKVSLVKWIITPRQEDGKFRPTEIVDSFEDFPSEAINRKDYFSDLAKLRFLGIFRFHPIPSGYIPYVFGKDIERHIQGFIDGNYDWLVRLPDDLLIYLLTYLNLEDIERLSHVCVRLRTVCTSNALWKELFHLHMPSLVSPAVESLAAENGWKSVFYSRIFERKLRAKHLLQSQSSEASTPRTASAVSRESTAISRTPDIGDRQDDAESLASWRPTTRDDSEELELESVVG